MKISVHKEKCTGCCICELACSFHHTKAFSSNDASIRICFNSEGSLDINLLSTCDLCVKEKVPLCMEFCPSRAIKLIRTRP
jgi:carbon-monoxide dehydrogenase iron sulfur subunit